jgi:3-deoxy-manno-octulosonate cytidylyltransferase (CMP-KDO synthetase)
VLADLHGRPLLWHVWHRVRQAAHVAEVFIATDSPTVRDAAQEWGARTLMTGHSPRSGTERIAAVLEHLPGEFIVNVQGDQPLIEPSLVDELVECWQADPCDVITPVYRLLEPENLTDPSVVKVVRARDGNALYFSRNAIPAVKDAAPASRPQAHAYWGHVGVYGYRRRALVEYLSTPPTPLEQAEQLEQLRFLEVGRQIRTIETDCYSISIDTPADLQRARGMATQR